MSNGYIFRLAFVVVNVHIVLRYERFQMHEFCLFFWPVVKCVCVCVDRANLTETSVCLCFTFAGCAVVDALDWHNQIFLGHQIIFGDKLCEATTQICFIFKVVEYSSMMEIGVRENAIDSTAHRAQLSNRGFFD